MKKKKIGLGLAACALILSAGTVVASAASGTDGVFSAPGSGGSFFERMLPHARQMHPALSDEQLREMAAGCSRTGETGRFGMMNGR
ncbi:FAD/FMN-containing dehydrogenase [Gorillibacterium sp. sgz500922]|uniref:FAD/FMN-containing dehydrogenase n=1 Tax=Gorillibacterium sp. sgz500922 TaxID=3446694 RepID=UPI003F67E2E3